MSRFDYRRLPWAFVSSAVDGYRNRELFDGVEAYCTFIGHARSGTSLVGSLLTAHPDMVIAHEFDALRYIRFRFTRNQVYSLLMEKDVRFTRAGLRQVKIGYEFEVPGAWQGRYRDLKVIGDKRGGASTRQLKERPYLLDRLRRTVGVPVRLVHLTRNPFDNISTIARRSSRTLEEAVDRYFERCETVRQLREQLGDDVLHIRYEDFLSDAKDSLRRVCGFLGVDAEDDYLSACSAIVWSSSRRTRNDAGWTPDLVRSVEKRMGAFTFLAGYSFED